jgi:hypothetical protein
VHLLLSQGTIEARKLLIDWSDRLSGSRHKDADPLGKGSVFTRIESRCHSPADGPGGFNQLWEKAFDNDGHSGDPGDPGEIDASNDFVASIDWNSDGIPAVICLTSWKVIVTSKIPITSAASASTYVGEYLVAHSGEGDHGFRRMATT